MAIEQKPFGKISNGKETTLFTLTNTNNACVKITNYGATVVSVIVPDKQGKMEDVVLGYNSPLEYEKYDGYFGAVIGRNCNRIENAEFCLNGHKYCLNKNDGKNNLHSGPDGFDSQIWDYEVSDNCLKMFLRSGDGQSGFPGCLDVEVTYKFSDDNELSIDYLAVCDKDTVVNLTNHSYFNLAGHNSGTVLNHKIKINSDKFTEITDECITNGIISDVVGTPFDFRQYREIGQQIDEKNQQICNGKGYDHNWILRGDGYRNVAALLDDKSGRVMEVFTDRPAVQFYSGNFLDGRTGKDGATYSSRDAVCLETQGYPNAMKYDFFPSVVLKAGEKYKTKTAYRFSIK